jgi:hypothetical protein
MADTHADNPHVQHETTDVNIRGILAFGAGLLFVGLVIHILVWGLFRYFDGREIRNVTTAYPLAAGQEMREPPAPRLQVAPRLDLQQFRAREDAILTGYQWIDREAGTVRIPIEEAMRLTVQRGLPIRKPPEATRP